MGNTSFWLLVVSEGILGVAACLVVWVAHKIATTPESMHRKESELGE